MFYFDIYISLKKKKISWPAKFCSLQIFVGILAASQIFALLVSFYHNVFIRTLFWVILVSLESLESVESKYRQKEHF